MIVHPAREVNPGERPTLEYVHVFYYACTESGVDFRHLIQPFAHSLSFDLKSVAVVDDVAKPAERAELPRQRVVEQGG